MLGAKCARMRMGLQRWDEVYEGEDGRHETLKTYLDAKKMQRRWIGNGSERLSRRA